MNALGAVEIDSATVFVEIVSVLTFILQLFICLRTEKIYPKLIPSVLFVISAIVFYVLSAYYGGWDGMGFLFFAVFSFWLFVVSVITWVICSVVRKKII